MPVTPSLQTLIAHYLASNYPAALASFLTASGQAQPDLTSPIRPDLHSLVNEFFAYQASIDLASVSLGDESEDHVAGSWKGWSATQVMKLELAPDTKLEGIRRTIEGVTASNLLTVGVESLPRRIFNTSTAAYESSYFKGIITTSVDKVIRILNYNSGEVEQVLEPHRAAILSFSIHPENSRYLLTSSMDGTTILNDLITSSTLQTFKSTKFVVRVLFSPKGRYFATASYDRSVVIYEAAADHTSPPNEDDDALDDTDDHALACEPTLRYKELKRISTDSNPETLLFHPGESWLLYTLRSSHLLYYVNLATGEKKTKSFNPHPMDTHVSFSVLNLVLHPSGKVVACQTGDHRGATGERILFYGIEPEETDRMDCIWTGSEGDDFVLPRMDWLPDGTGIITTTPYGNLNLITLQGQTRSSVKIHGAAELGQASSEVVRDCCVVAVDDEWEVVSVGYDRKIRISR